MSSLSRFTAWPARVAGVVLAFALAGGATYALAQNDPAAPAVPTAVAAGQVFDEAQVERGLQVFKDGGCRACHGWAANGVREGEAVPAPSLRETLLTPADIHTTVQCGRPSRNMPYFDRQAYNFDGRCYGLDRNTIGDLKPPQGRVGFNAPQIDDLVVYLQARVIGLPNDPTLAQCELFFGAGNNQCSIYQ